MNTHVLSAFLSSALVASGSLVALAAAAAAA